MKRVIGRATTLGARRLDGPMVASPPKITPTIRSDVDPQ